MKLRREGVLHQSMLALFVKGFGAIAAFLMNLVMARTLGAEQGGYFFLGFTVVTFLGAVSRCGFDNVILRHTAAACSRGDGLAVRQLFLKGAGVTFLVSGAVAIGLWLAADGLSNSVFGKPDFGPVLAAIAPGVVTMALLWQLAQSFQGMGYVSSAIIAMNAAANIALVVIVWCLGVRDGEQAALAYSLGAIFVLVGFQLFWYRAVKGVGTGTHQNTSLCMMFRSAWPLWIVLLMNQLILWTGQFVGGAYLQPEEIAQLAVAQRTAFW